ncbi:hypothetical protein NFI96_009750, partial [Prochilodus magdalenae]
GIKEAKWYKGQGESIFTGEKYSTDGERQTNQEKEKLLIKKTRPLQMKEKMLEEREKLLQETKCKLEQMVKETQIQKTELTHQQKEIEEKELQLKHTAQQNSDLHTETETLRSVISSQLTVSGESCSSASPVSVPVAELRLVLLGRTGCGKSAAAGKTLSAEREKRSQAGASTVRQQSESRQGEVAGRQVTVVDTPDWFCPGLPLEELRQDVGHCVRLSAPGPHAFLLVMPVKQSTGEERGMLEKMEEMFGERCWRNTMILLTVTDEVQEKNIEEFIQSGNQEIQRLVEKCGNRFHCLNIKESGDGSQTSELLEKIEKMVEGDKEEFYSSEIYLEIESQIREIERRIVREREEMRERAERETREKLERCVEETFMKFTESAAHFHTKLNQHEERITKLEEMLKKERDEKIKVELEREVEREIQQKNEVQLELERLKEETEKERRKMAERHRQEMEEISETYEGEARMEAERNLMKILLPELQQRFLVLMSKMQEKFSRQMAEKDRELKTLTQRVGALISMVQEMCREAAKYGDSIHLKEYTESVTGYISKCIDDVTISKVIATHPNQKPWMTTEVRVLLGTRDKAFKSGDKASLRTARAKLSWAIREAKRTYAQKIHSHFQNTADMHRMWQCIQAVTNYKTPSPTCDSDASLPNVLNSFYARFEAQNCTTARKTTPLSDEQALCLSTADVRKSLLRVKPLSQIAVLAECTENVLTN